MRPAYSTLVTNQQLRNLFAAWESSDAQVPRKGQVTILHLPSAELKHIEVRPTEHKCTYKKSVLYKVEMWPNAPSQIPANC